MSLLSHFYVSFPLLLLLPAASWQDATKLMTCRKGWVTYSNACYQFNEFPISPWYDAGHRCSSTLSSLLTIENDEERQWITSQIINFSTVQTWWIGLQGLDRSSYQWTQKTILTSYSPPFANEPDNANGKEDCAMISSRGLLRDEICSRAQRFICKAKKADVVEPCATTVYAGIPRDSSNYCYWFVFIAKKSWDDSKQFCRSVQLKNSHEKVDLLSLNDEEEVLVVQRDLNILRAFGAAWWTGLRYQDEDKSYTYSDGTTYSATSTPWLTKEAMSDKEDDCGAILSNGFVTALACNVNMGYICKHSRVRLQSQVCPDYWIRAKDSCYFIDQTTLVNRTTAHYSCQKMGGHLLKTDSLDEKNWLDRAGVLQYQRFWTGLYVRKGSQPGVFKWDDNTNLDKSLIIWDNSDLSGAHCTRLNVKSGKFIYAQCDREIRNLACEYKVRTGQSSCIQGWRHNGQKCYYFSTGKRNTWLNTPEKCSKVTSNQDRNDVQEDVNYITVENFEELDFVQKTAKSLDMDALWLGLNNLGEDKNWRWKGAPTVPSNTVSRSPSSGQPNMKYNCVSISYGGLYKTTDCGDSQNSFICETNIPETNLAPPRVDSRSAALGSCVMVTLMRMLLML